MYNYQAKLLFKQYIPKSVEEGMLFVMFVDGKPQLIEWSSPFPVLNEKIIETYGYPVELYIVEEEDFTDIICEPQDLGWFDEGEDCDELHEFSLKEANFILYEYDGLLEIQIEEDPFDEDEQIIPIYVEQKVIIKYVEEDELI